MDIRHLFLSCLRKRGTEPLILEGGHSYTLAELAGQVAALSDLLRCDESASGAIPILLPNTRAFIVAFYGAVFAGKIPVPINPMLPPKELAQMLDEIGARALLTISLLKPMVEKLLAEAPGVQVIYLDQLAMPAGGDCLTRLEAMAEEPAAEVACMLFSSGTMGRPKAVMLTHHNLITNNLAVQKCWEFLDDDVIFGLLPFFHSYGLCILHLALWGGGKFLMVPRFNPADTLLAIREQKVTIILLVPEMFKVLARSEGCKEVNWQQLRLCLTGGGPAPASLRQLWRETTGVTMYSGYGLTECSPVVSIGIPGMYKENSVGKPLPGVAVRIVDGEGHALPARQDGEILIQGPLVMKGYYQRPEATAEMIDAEGWLHTGDVGLLDEEGFLYVSGRAKEIIIVAGENVLPQEVEEALGQHPAVAESAVVGAPDEMRGEVPYAFVVTRSGAQVDSAELRGYLREHLVSYKIPREIVLVEQLPKSALGKVLRRQLKEKIR